MGVWRKLQLSIVAILLFAGTFVIIGDLLFVRQYGADYNDVAFVTRTGAIADWPTGERPLYAYVPAAGYGFAAWFVAALVLVPWPEIPQGYSFGVRRGTQ